MLNIKELEHRHKKYKIKLYAPYIIFILLLIIILIASNIIINTQYVKPTKKIIKKEQTTTTKSIIELNTTQEKKEHKTQKVILYPSLDFMKRVNTPVDIYNKIDNNVKKQDNIIIEKKKRKKEKIIEKIVVKEKIEPIKIKKKSSLTIKINKDQNDINDVIKRFKTNNNPALSLFIAKKYYQLGNYHKSYNYALITNQLNNNIEASWIIFAKSLIKLKKREMAINTLKKYIDNSHSPRAKILLDEIQSGKFK